MFVFQLTTPAVVLPMSAREQNCVMRSFRFWRDSRVSSIHCSPELKCILCKRLRIQLADVSLGSLSRWHVTLQPTVQAD